MKYCNKCNTQKSLTEFYICKRNGYQSKCKDCEKKYKLATKDKDKINKRNHYLRNIDKIKKRVKEYNKINRNKMRKALFINRPEQKIVHNQRTRLNALLKSKKQNSSSKLLGCTAIELRAYIEKQFTDGMNWDNYGRNGWHIDHIIPCSRFDLTNVEQQKQCFHYTNLQPMWAKDNIIKSNKMFTSFQIKLIA